MKRIIIGIAIFSIAAMIGFAGCVTTQDRNGGGGGVQGSVTWLDGGSIEGYVWLAFLKDNGSVLLGNHTSPIQMDGTFSFNPKGDLDMKNFGSGKFVLGITIIKSDNTLKGLIKNEKGGFVFIPVDSGSNLGTIKVESVAVISQ